MSNKVLGDKIKDILCWLMDNTVAKTHSSKIFNVIGCVDELIEKANKVDDLQTELVTTATDLSEALDRVVELDLINQRQYQNGYDKAVKEQSTVAFYNHYEKLVKKANRIDELEKKNRMIQLQNDEITNFFQMKYVELKQLKQDALLGEALIHLANTDHEHDMLRYLQYDAIYQTFRLPDGDGAYDILVTDWYQEQMKKEGCDG